MLGKEEYNPAKDNPVHGINAGSNLPRFEIQDFKIARMK
jgi:hypothetical protein